MRRGKACGTHNLSQTPFIAAMTFRQTTYTVLSTGNACNGGSRKIKSGVLPAFFQNSNTPEKTSFVSPESTVLSSV